MYILVFWTIVGAGSIMLPHDWRALGEFKSQIACVNAAKTLNIAENKFRCIKTE